MRALRQPRLLAVSAPVGLGLAALCIPLILAEAPAGSPRWLQLAALPLLCVLLIQAALAWLPGTMRALPGLTPGLPRRRWAELAALAVAVAALRMLTDVWLRRLLVIPEVSDWAAFGRKLPFAGLVQPLFLVVGVYAFALRLSLRPRLALVAVVLCHQLIVLLQFGSLVAAGALAAMLIVAGVQGLIMGGALVRYGPVGPALLAVAGYGRHALYLLFPVLAGVARA